MLVTQHGERQVLPALHASLRTVATFVISGLTHEYLTWGTFGQFTGCYMAFFGLHCAGVLMEQLESGARVPAAGATGPRCNHCDGRQCANAKKSKYGRLRVRQEYGMGRLLLMCCWTWAVCFLSTPLFFEPLRAAGVYNRCAFQPFGVAVTSMVVRWLAQQTGSQLAFATL